MTKIQDIQTEQNTNPKVKFRGSDVIIINYTVDQLTTIKDSLELPLGIESKDIKYAEIKYDYLSGDAFRIGEAFNILKLQYNSLDKIFVNLPYLHFSVDFHKTTHMLPTGYLNIQSEFTPRALEPIVGNILENVHMESLEINFGTLCGGENHFRCQISVPVASYIFNKFEEHFSSSITVKPSKQYAKGKYYYASYIYNKFEEYFSSSFKVKVQKKYGKPIYYSFYLGETILKNMAYKLLKHDYGYKMTSLVPTIEKELKDFTVQELLEATLITRNLNNSPDNSLKKLPDEILKKIFFEHVGAQELCLIANRGRMNLYYDKIIKHKFKTIGFKTAGEKKLLSKQIKELNANTIDTFSTFMLLNEHLGNEVFQNKNITHTVELGIAGVLSFMAYKNGISYEYSYLPLVRAGSFVAKDASYSQKESIKQKLSQYLPTESYSDEVDLFLNFVFDLAIAYASPNFSMSLLVSGANSVSNYLEASFGSSYSTLSTNYFSMTTSAVTALWFASNNRHVLQESSKYPVYNLVSYLLGIKCIYEITNILSAKALDLVGITPENVVEGIEAVKEYEIGRDITTEEAVKDEIWGDIHDASSVYDCGYA